MYIVRVFLENFRNYPRIDWEPDRHLNVVSGSNGQGKTNLLEAIFFGLAGRSFRTNRDRELVRWTTGYGRVELVCSVKNSQQLVFSMLTADGKKERQLNGRNLKPKDEIILPVVFTPDHLDIIKGGPQERRRWMDQDLGFLYPGYTFHLRRYQQVLAHRNDLLQQIREKRRLVSELDPWNQQLASYGSRIIAWRLSLLARLTPLVREIYGNIVSGSEKLSISYLSSLSLNGLGKEEEIHRFFLDQLAKSRGNELARGQTLIGPHRDDLAFSLNGHDARQYGSQGQQRTIVLALKLAQLELGQLEYGEYPILLLDDVFSELDPLRRKQLISRVGDMIQVFLSTSTPLRDVLSGFTGQIITIRDNQLYEEV